MGCKFEQTFKGELYLCKTDDDLGCEIIEGFDRQNELVTKGALETIAAISLKGILSL